MSGVRALLAFLAVLTAPALTSAQAPATGSEIALRIEGDDWIYWPHAAAAELQGACASPCLVELPRGEVALDMAAPTESAPQHRRTLVLDAATTLCVRRWSHEGERVFGAVFLSVGGTAAIVVAGLGALFGSVGWMIMGPTGAGLLALVLAIGIPFVAWSDAPTLDVAGVVRAIAGPGDVGVGVAVSL